MAPYYPITICRSDGLLEVKTKGITELNQPTTPQLDDTPDNDGNVDCYKKLESDEPKAVDWRRKLGGMMMHVLGGKGHADKNYILKELPEGYVLWEHVKYNVDKAAEEKKKEKGKHAAGVFERQDAYLYGHPQGRKKRFRSPADFFPHLLWLATDPEGDARNCSCKICSPDGEEEVVNEPTRVEAPVKKETRILPPSVVAIKSAPATAVAKPIPQAPTGGVRSAEQKVDGEANGIYLYRPGELVWFNKGAAWGLAVVSKRQAINRKARYMLQPLSHPLHHLPFQIQDEEYQIRPWLAWSLPATTHPAISNMSFDQVPWDRVVRGEFGRHDPDVDGSILAAKAIDSSYSLFDRLENALTNPGEVHFNGMFLGAEKIWIGEPVRLRVPSDEIVILVIQKLIERATPTSSSAVTFVGDVFKFVEMPTPYKTRAEWPTPALPERMIADLMFRNEVADTAKTGLWYEWRLLEPAARKELSDIKGRWYETRKLLPILRGQQLFEQEILQGKTTDAGLWMNGRGDSSLGPGIRKKNRKDTIGMAVPPDFKVSRGLDGPPSDDLFPDALPPQDTQMFADGNMDNFLDLGQTVAGHNELYGGEMQH